MSRNAYKTSNISTCLPRFGAPMGHKNRNCACFIGILVRKRASFPPLWRRNGRTTRRRAQIVPRFPAKSDTPMPEQQAGLPVSGSAPRRLARDRSAIMLTFLIRRRLSLQNPVPKRSHARPPFRRQGKAPNPPRSHARGEMRGLARFRERSRVK